MFPNNAHLRTLQLMISKQQFYHYYDEKGYDDGDELNSLMAWPLTIDKLCSDWRSDESDESWV